MSNSLPTIQKYLTADDLLRNKLDLSRVRKDDKQMVVKWNESKGFLFYSILKKAIDEQKEVLKQQKLLELRNKREIKKQPSITFETWLKAKNLEATKKLHDRIDKENKARSDNLDRSKEKKRKNYIAYNKWLDEKNSQSSIISKSSFS